MQNKVIHDNGLHVDLLMSRLTKNNISESIKDPMIREMLRARGTGVLAPARIKLYKTESKEIIKEIEFKEF